MLILLSPSGLVVTCVSGGITNQLYRVSEPESSASVLFRRFGPETERIIDRKRESLVCKVFTERHQFGPAVLAYCDGGRVEEWLEGHALKPLQMREEFFQPRIGAKLAELHALDMSSIPASDDEREQGQVWARLGSWFDEALRVVDEVVERDDVDGKERKVRSREEKAKMVEAMRLKELAGELRSWKAKLCPGGARAEEAHPSACSPVVFCHCDLLSGNIMYDADSDKMTLIDFEYSAYNSRAFDIANHFCEYCGFDCNWDNMPTKPEQERFFRGYLGSDKQADLDRLYEEVNPWIPVAHLWWGVWSFVQARFSPIDFDFLGYSAQKIDAYWQSRSTALSMLEQ